MPHNPIKILPREARLRDTETSRMLALLRFPLALIIVSVHWFDPVRPLKMAGIEPTADAFPIWNAIANFFRIYISENGIGTFFLISGFLFFACADIDRHAYKTKVRKRVDTLLIPYLIWNCIALIESALSSLHFHIKAGLALSSWTPPFTLTEALQGFFFTPMPHLTPLWFIRELMLAVLLVPILLPILRKYPVITVTILGAGAITAGAFELLPLRNIFISLTFFNAGAVLSLARCDLYRTFLAAWRPALPLYILLCTGSYLCEADTPALALNLKFLSILPAVALLLSLSANIVKSTHVEPNQFLTRSTFFIFASHVLLLTYLGVILCKIINPQTDVTLTITFIIGYPLLILVIIALYALMLRLLPRTTSLLTGRRSSLSQNTKS